MLTSYFVSFSLFVHSVLPVNMEPSVLFIHPDLGIGGAERLVVDAALALKARRCKVQVWTAHYDVNHCFSETKDSGIPIRCCGDWLPRSIFGKCFALCAYIRMIFLAFYIVFLSGEQFDIVFCDQVCIILYCYYFLFPG